MFIYSGAFLLQDLVQPPTTLPRITTKAAQTRRHGATPLAAQKRRRNWYNGMQRRTRLQFSVEMILLVPWSMMIMIIKVTNFLFLNLFQMFGYFLQWCFFVRVGACNASLYLALSAEQQYCKVRTEYSIGGNAQVLYVIFHVCLLFFILVQFDFE